MLGKETQQKLLQENSCILDLNYFNDGLELDLISSQKEFQYPLESEDDFTYADLMVEEMNIQAQICYLNEKETKEVVTNLAIYATREDILPTGEELLQLIEQIQKDGRFVLKNVSGFLQPDQIYYARGKGLLKLSFILQNVLLKVGSSYRTNQVKEYMKRLKQQYNEINSSFKDHPPSLLYL